MLSQKHYSLLNEFLNSDIPFPNSISPELEYLIDTDYVITTEYKISYPEELHIQIGPTKLVISDKGKKALQEFEQTRNKIKEEKREKKNERIFQIFLVFLGAILGVVASYFFDIVEFFTRHI